MAIVNLSEDVRNRFDAVRERADRLGVLDINFSGANSADPLKSFEATLDVIEANKEILDRNAGELET